MDGMNCYNYNILERCNKKVKDIESIIEVNKGVKIIFKNKDVIYLKPELQIRDFGITPEIKVEL